MFSATSFAFVSGRLISLMRSWIFLPIDFCSFPPSFSMLAPLAPISTPGRPVWMITVTRCGMADDLHLGDVGALGLLGVEDGLSQPQVLVQRRRVQLGIHEPPRGPGLVDPQPKPDRTNLLTHCPPLSRRSRRRQPKCGTTASAAGPRGRGRGPTSSSCVGPTSMRSSFTYSICSSRFLFCARALAAADWMSFAQQPRALVREHVQERDGLDVRLAPHVVGDPPHLRRGHPLERDVRAVPRRPLAGAARGPRGSRAVLRCVAHFFTTFLSDPEWPRKIRVGENSPSLWPTRFSVTYTGTHVLPLYTEIV